MIENNSEPGIPEKPVLPPSFNNAYGPDTMVSDDASNTTNVAVKSRWRRLGRKPADASQPVTAATALSESQRGVAGPARRKIAWYWVAVAALALLVGGVVLGTTIPDPKKSKEFVALQSEKDGVSSDLASLQGRFDSMSSGIKSRESTFAIREAAVVKSAADVKTADAAVKAAEAAVKKREDAVAGAEKTKAANTVKEGTWTVGLDIEPGTYRANADVTSGCYWGIYRTGSNGSDIVDNDIVNGGRPSVTLSAGQDFKTSRCGTWSKQ